ncbi:hypothetical protein CTI12_AA418700 [Artemisia annua]|uniref:Uncharacterized protein n=1 Tax=Artemisia annua TaxID=35608 RepID=A0A2U1M401_ARTAN|nr:hypothetical protein CTI12_AA418700 [Artemisia annua]
MGLDHWDLCNRNQCLKIGTHGVMDLGSLEMTQNKYTLTAEMSRRLCSIRPVRIWSPANKKVVGGQQFPKAATTIKQQPSSFHLAKNLSSSEIQGEFSAYLYQLDGERLVISYDFDPLHNIQNLRTTSDHKTIIQEICSSTHKRFTPSFRGIAAGQAVEDMEVLSSNLL